MDMLIVRIVYDKGREKRRLRFQTPEAQQMSQLLTRYAGAVLADIVTKMKERTAAEKRPPPKMTEGDEDEDDDDEDDFEEAN